MRELLSKENRCFLFDLMSDPKFEDWGVLVDDTKDAIRLAGRTSRFHIRLELRDVERFDHMCSLLVKEPHGLGLFHDTCIAVDELAFFCNAHSIPYGLEYLVRVGRHTGAKLLATTQRPPDIHSLVLSQSKEWYLFQMHLPRDVNYLKQFVPDIERVRGLNRGEYILWHPSEYQKATEPTNAPPSLESSEGS